MSTTDLPCTWCELLPDRHLADLIDVHGGTWTRPACVTTYQLSHLDAGG